MIKDIKKILDKHAMDLSYSIVEEDENGIIFLKKSDDTLVMMMLKEDYIELQKYKDK
jgi:hypothetical protein